LRAQLIRGSAPALPGRASRASAFVRRGSRPRGIRFRRFYTTPDADPFESVAWAGRDVRLADHRGGTVFEQREVEAPAAWSDAAVRMAAAKYFRRRPGAPREASVRQMIARVAGTLGRWGREGGYFAGEEDAAAFEAELVHILLHQIACFNSPVWFNVGVMERPQCAGSFILSVEDSVESILELARTEGLLCKHGSGTGTNLSSLRAAGEPLAGGGRASGPVSFMRGLDACAGMIRSGGRTRRAARMEILDAGHPDVLEFIQCKAVEERKAWALVESGFESDFDAAAGAYGTVAFQNANHSVRVPDELLEAVVAGGPWTTRTVTDGRPAATLPARELMRRIAEAAWLCGDPGVQYDTTINAWNPCPAAGRIRASNSCSEYMFLDDTGCPLASVNLMRFLRPGGEFDADACRHVCAVMTSALEMTIDRSGYPSEAVGLRSRRFRPVGLGYSNLGALLMASGLPYDSGGARHYAAAITALVSGAASAQSARIARALGAFAELAPNRDPMLAVLGKHRRALRRIGRGRVPRPLLAAAERAWDEALRLGAGHGLRNAQVSCLAPTGTISFLMDCDTTGVEPDLALVKSKRLAGGGTLEIVNRTVPAALERLGYRPEEIRDIVAHLEGHGSLQGAPHLDERHLPVFDCAFPPPRGGRLISVRGHLRMTAAVQPFLSGGISKTVNLPESATPEDVERVFLEGWRLKLKAVAVYRDGCKRSQPVSARG
jgi:ribonucleoside-diphosphate reductase alpha chain